jgi:hypothetical protein
MTVAEIFSTAFHVLRSASAWVAFYLVTTVAMYVAGDLGIIWDALSFVFLLITVGLGYLLTLELFRRSSLVGAPHSGRFLQYMGLTVLMTLGIVLGLVFLIIPGLIFAARWTPALGYLFVDGEGPAGSMSKAWDRTGDHFGPIFSASLVPMILIFGTAMPVLVLNWFGGATVLGIDLDPSSLGLLASIAVNVASSSGQVLSLGITVAVYALLEGNPQSLENVFD